MAEKQQKERNQDMQETPQIEEATSITLATQYPPMRILEVELGEALPMLSSFDERTEKHYQRALCTIRLHTHPLGTLELSLPAEPDHYAPLIWNALHSQINDHLREDGLPPASALDAMGLPSTTTPACELAREQFLANAPFVSVIVSTHERADQLTHCLSSLLALRYPHFEIIIVDNAPRSNATCDVVQRAQAGNPHLRYIREEHAGISFARNSGIKAARGEILAFTDDDVRVDPHWLLELARTFQTVENVACVTGLVLPMELETPAQFWFEEFGGFTHSFTQYILDTGKHHPHTPLFPFALGGCGVGASMAFTASSIREIGGFDLALGSDGRSPHTEDIDAFFRIIMQGYTLVYTPTALLYHQHRREVASLHQQIYNYGVGFTAQMLKIVCAYPYLAFALALKVPLGVFRILNTSSEKNQTRSSSFPKELSQLELKGMLYGPLAYLQTYWHLRGVSRKLD